MDYTVKISRFMQELGCTAIWVPEDFEDRVVASNEVNRAGLILTGAVVCSEEFEPAPCQKLTSIKDVYMLHQVAERVHHYGAKFGIQLSPGIGRMNWIDPNTPP